MIIKFYTEAQNLNTKLHLWQFITLAHYFKNEFPTVELVETTLDVKSLVLPEGSMPQMKSASRWPQLVSRFLRDADSNETTNPWLKEFGYDKMAAASWHGQPIYDAMVYDKKRTSCKIRFLSEKKWISHLRLGEKFESAG